MEAERYYHIYNRANGFENLFESDENYNYFLRQWAKYIEPIAESYAYCLMPNHFHFLIKIRKEEVLLEFFKDKLKLDQSGFENLTGLISKQFSNLFVSYSKAFNKMYNRNGALFQRPFKRKQITSDTYLTNVLFYIHHNPVHHGFTVNIEDWEHSSFHSLLKEKPTKIQRNEVNDWFGGLEAMKKFHTQNIKNLEKLELEFTN